MPPFAMTQALELMMVRLTFPPAVIGWNRLEGRPRTEQFDRALRAEVRDALWFLTRQWQFGEFKGEDAGSPVEVRTAVRVDPIQHYAVHGQGAVAFENSIPLEAHVERETILFSLTIQAEVSRYFWQLAAGVASPPTIRGLYVKAYPLSADSVAGYHDEDTRHAMQWASSRVFDARTLMKEVASGAHETRVDAFAGISTSDRAILNKAGGDLRDWFLAQFSQPTDASDDAWNTRFLEYQFS